MDFIPVNEPLLNGNEKKYLEECIDSGWISSEGPFVKELEVKFSNRIGRKYGVAVCNGTAALEACGNALDRQIEKGVSAGGGPKAGEPGPLNCDHFFQATGATGNGWPPNS